MDGLRRSVVRAVNRIVVLPLKDVDSILTWRQSLFSNVVFSFLNKFHIYNAKLKNIIRDSVWLYHYSFVPDEAENFDILSVLKEDQLPDGVARIPGRCQSPSTPEDQFLAYRLNENATLHQLSAGMFYNTFPEDFSVLAVVRLSGENH